MQNLRTALDLGALTAEAVRQDFRRDGAGIDMAHNSDSGFPAWLPKAPQIQAAIAEIEGLVNGKANHIMLNRLRPHDNVLPHRDQMDVGERWHLPLVTNPRAIWWDEMDGKEVHMEVGFWYGPVPYKVEHSVWNDGETERIHLVVDVHRLNERR